MASTTASIDSDAARTSRTDPARVAARSSRSTQRPRGAGLESGAGTRTTLVGVTVAVVVVVAALGFVGWWFPVAVVLRELMLLGVRPLLRSRGLTSLPTHLLSGPAAGAVLLGAALLVLTGPAPLLGDTVAALAAVLGWALALWGLALQWWLGAVHLWQVRTLLQQVPPQPRERSRRTSRASRAVGRDRRRER